MSNLIKLLPDAVANQIAAGEVVQRPTSVVKELLENAIDAGATDIQLIIKDAGKTLVQVIDNGCGMGETDARMCFERHATSKISQTTDLFQLRTKGFRGEAMASIAAVAQVEMKTRLTEDEIGIKINIEGSKVISQEPIQTTQGTSIAVKNLFFNVPARRNFLKSNTVEVKHIIDEFERVALTHPEIQFKMTNNGAETFLLPLGSLRQRIVSVFGKKFNQKLVPLNETTSILNITGFIGKPEFSKKTRGEQFFFVNKRFIKNSYLHHAVMSAYEDLIHKKNYPSYFIYIEVEPSTIDINIHPTKTEIKFEDERAVYAIVNSTVKQSIGKHQMAPSLDFESETSFDIQPLTEHSEIKIPQIKVNPNFNPFEKKTDKPFSKFKKTTENYQKSTHQFDQQQALTDFYQESANIIIQEDEKSPQQQEFIEVETKQKIYQLHNKYIFSQIKSGYVIIDQQKAHERILYEDFLVTLSNKKSVSQQQLFPVKLEFNASEFSLLEEIWEEINLIGFDIEKFGTKSIAVNGVPADLRETNIPALFDSIIEQFKNNKAELKLDNKESIARAMAKSMAIKSKKALSEQEMILLTDQLFGCESPYYSPSGKKTILTVTLADLEKQFT